MKLSIRSRLLFSFSLIFTLLIILFSGVIYYLMSNGLENEFLENAHHDLNQILHVFKQGTWEEQLAEMPEESEEFQVLIHVIDDTGKILFRNEEAESWDWAVHPEALSQASIRPVLSNEEINGISHLILTRSFMPQGKPLHFLQIAKSRAHLNFIRDRLIYCINIGTPLILVITVFIGTVFTKKALGPVEQIQRRAKSIKTDNLNERLSYDGPPDELFRLTETLNELLERIQLTLEQMKNFIADASHEMRIPLTGLRGTLEVALRQDRSKEEYKRVVETAYAESERLSELVWDLLSLANSDTGGLKLEIESVNIKTLLQTVIDEAHLLNKEGKVRLLKGDLPEGEIRIDEAKVHQVLINILENAINYNKPGGKVVLTARKASNRLIVTVTDNGMGIPTEDQPKIFNRFYRVDKARSRESGGTGLGLSIARSITEAHQGTLEVKSELGVGSEFTLTLPLS